MAEEFKPGDQVTLKSGGPIMTVQESLTAFGGRYRCQWFAGKKLESGMFVTESLVKAEATDAGNA